MPTVLGGRLAVLTALALALSTCTFSTGASPSPPTSSAASPMASPSVSPAKRALAAYVADGGLFLLGAAGSARPITPSGTPSGTSSQPQWSYDGTWLAYLLSPAPGSALGSAPGSALGEVHVVRGDGGGDHALSFAGGDFAWSPAALLLAFTTVDGASLAVAPPDGSPTELVKAGKGSIDSFVWSHDGAKLAYSIRPPLGSTASDQLLSVSVDGGRFDRWQYAAPSDTGFLLAGWWPDGKGVLLWLDPAHSASIAADGLALVSVPRSGHAVAELTKSVPHHPWLAWSREGSLLMVSGSGREPWDGKALMLCRPPPGRCSSLPQPQGTVSVDPAWSTDGTQIAFVRAPSRTGADAGKDPAAWYQSRRLWVAASDGSGAREVQGAGPGVAAPSWAPDGVTLRYSTATDIRSVPTTGGTSTRLAGPLTGGADAGWTQMGKQPWSGVAVWAPGA